MYKSKEKQREAVRKAVSKHCQGITSEKEGITYPDIIDKLTDSKWRSRLEKICLAFKESHNPKYAEDVYLGISAPCYPMDEVCNLLEATR